MTAAKHARPSETSQWRREPGYSRSCVCPTSRAGHYLRTSAGPRPRRTARARPRDDSSPLAASGVGLPAFLDSDFSACLARGGPLLSLQKGPRARSIGGCQARGPSQSASVERAWALGPHQSVASCWGLTSPTSRIRPKSEIQHQENQCVGLKGLHYRGGTCRQDAATILGGGWAGGARFMRSRSRRSSGSGSVVRVRMISRPSVVGRCTSII